METCRPCGPGGVYVVNGAACVACPAGTWSNIVNAASCTACPQFSTPNAAKSGCVCNTGYKPALNGSEGCIISCNPGYKNVVGAVCQPCGYGKYSVYGDSCDSCLPRYTTPIVNATSASYCVCEPGTAPLTESSTAECGTVCGPGQRLDPIADACVDCGSGSYSNTTDFAISCTSCPALGAVSPAAATSVSQCGCDAGRAAQWVDGALVCASWCPAGYSRPQAMEDCEVCGLSSYTEEPNEAVCRSCPANTFTQASQSSSVTYCRCRPGYYSTSGKTGVPCTACPNGAKCSGGTVKPEARPGFAPVDGGSFVACTPPQACAGGGDCADGYTGDRCESCMAGKFASGCAGLLLFVL